MTDLEITSEDIQAMATEVAEGPAETNMQLHIFTNDPTNPMAAKQLEMLYRAVMTGRVGLMHAQNVDSGKIETLLVGVDSDPTEGLLTFPIARLLTEDDMGTYLPPDGHGGYSVPSPTVN